MMDRMHSYLPIVISCIITASCITLGCSDNDYPEPEVIQITISPDTIVVPAKTIGTMVTIDMKVDTGQIATIQLTQGQTTALVKNTIDTEGIYAKRVEIENVVFIKKGNLIQTRLKPIIDNPRIFKIEIVADGYYFNPVFIRQEALSAPTEN